MLRLAGRRESRKRATALTVNRPWRWKIALLPWGHVIEDFLDSIGVGFESFRDEMTGGWLFGYVEAIKRVGIGTVIVCVSARVRPGRHVHSPTGAQIEVLPVTRSYRRLRPLMLDPYGGSFERMLGRPRSEKRLWRVVFDVAHYLPTPPLQLARVLRHARCDAVLCQEYEYPRFDLVVLLGRLLRMPVFATFQSGDYHLSRIERVVRPVALRACAGESSHTCAIRGPVRASSSMPVRMSAPTD